MNRHKISILIVEDNQSDIFLAESALEELEGYDVELIIAVDGEAGLKALLANDFNIAFVDFNLPKYDGPTILGKVGQGVREKCFMLTTSDAEENITQSERLKVAGYITKPLNQADFISALNAVVRVAVSKDVQFLNKRRK